MRHHHYRPLGWTALISVGMAAVFLWCHALGNVAHAGESREISRTLPAVSELTDSTSQPIHVGAVDCSSAVGGTQTVTGKFPHSKSFPTFIPQPPLAATTAIHLADYLVYPPKHSSLQHQSVLFRI